VAPDTASLTTAREWLRWLLTEKIIDQEAGETALAGVQSALDRARN
jgi:hypothetical protein